MPVAKTVQTNDGIVKPSAYNGIPKKPKGPMKMSALSVSVPKKKG